ncbi:hypothetical protein O1611_g7700 [Lasiodiplodia mahajangana]|uniref:Uncharacterized protein n=1 Tax=Lasiodiplodia mahajangana TaxID=1108764 RepID=A0ACC2JEN3_9PEZI|nr:hypothetical protein O1611_g7700 [Lasiodiplodia mahajangana]
MDQLPINPINPQERVLTWLKEQAELHGWPQPGQPPGTQATTCYSFCGDTFYSPSDLIDLRSSRTIRAYCKFERDGRRCRTESIPSLDLNRPAQADWDNPLEAQQTDDQNGNNENNLTNHVNHINHINHTDSRNGG